MRKRRVRKNFSAREKVGALRAAWTWKRIASFVTVAGIRAFVGQQMLAAARSELAKTAVAQVKAKVTGAPTVAGLGGFKALSDLGRRE